jgi:hypothetical protein
MGVVRLHAYFVPLPDSCAPDWDIMLLYLLRAETECGLP